MRFPITPDYLENVPEYIVRLYRDLEEDTLKDICRRLRGAGEITGSAVNQIRALRNRGLDLSYIDRRIKETLHFSEQEYEDIWSRAITRNQEYFDDVIQKADLVPSSFTLAGKKREFEAIRRQTLEEFRNISRSMGFAFRTGGGIQFLPIAKAYQKVLDDAEMKLLSGVADHNSAIKEAVTQLTASGLQSVDYASGWRNRVDVAARRAVMTGISQIAAQYSQDTMALLGTDLVEVTAHAGARDRGSGYVNHKSWQGKVYSMSGKSKKYPGLREATGYGLGGGLAGWNCRHSFFAFVDGVSERAYTDKQLSDIDPPPFDYQGRRYTAYEATQMQRKLETAMRQKKRELIGYEAAGLEEDHTATSIKLRRLQEEYESFSKAAGLRRQPQRAQVARFGRGQAARARLAKATRPAILNEEEKRAVLDYIGPASYKLNDKLRKGIPLEGAEARWAQKLDAALQKLPVVEGEVVRDVVFDDHRLFREFAKRYAVGQMPVEPFYVSATTMESYHSKPSVRMYIKSKSARDLRAYNAAEGEVLFPRGAQFRILEAEMQDGVVVLRMEEL